MKAAGAAGRNRSQQRAVSGVTSTTGTKPNRNCTHPGPRDVSTARSERHPSVYFVDRGEAHAPSSGELHICRRFPAFLWADPEGTACCTPCCSGDAPVPPAAACSQAHTLLLGRSGCDINNGCHPVIRDGTEITQQMRPLSARWHRMERGRRSQEQGNGAQGN